MDFNITAYITLVVTSGVLSLFLGCYAYAQRSGIPNARYFMMYSASLVVYIFSYAFELSSDTLAQIKFWTVMEYIGMPFSVVFGLMMTLQYLGKTVSRKLAAGLLTIPCITLLMVATNEYHHLFYKSVYLREGTATPLADVEIGQWYIVHGAYTFGCLLAGFVLLVSRWKHTNKIYRRQLVTLMASQLLPMISAFAYLMGWTPNGMDPVPVILCITSALYIWAIVSTRILTIVPIAKESIFEWMHEGVIVLDSSMRIVDYNQSMRKMMPVLGKPVVGREMDDVWLAWTGKPFPDIADMNNASVETEWKTGEDTLSYMVRVSALRNKSGYLLGYLVMLIDITERNELQKKLMQLAYYDGLTGIYNRMQFLQRSKELIERAELAEAPLAFILFDVDYFKRINDTYGHETGDNALKHVVTVCQQYLSADMLFARYGGEEFAIGLPFVAEEAAVRLAEQIRAGLNSGIFTAVTGQELVITCSFGIAPYRYGSSLESVLRDADYAMYASKRKGRNAVYTIGQALKEKELQDSGRISDYSLL
ncbi:histidine kinase N-terminal 7TM domain-containing diguanylate cyclase [Paenibacillus protaetiae]|uniref:Diguanylate cyclase n=1 Tax=Paenibacillus protaetiae TaxID=2509456 RepID=A0A4V0YER6_9BACL|nr:histidine kinase N-terminal 7TM domain-containing protein [Paenibacillus protaetiae]QAY65141.1 diguanylate cyclase [Paenibacillus protaetiae]